MTLTTDMATKQPIWLVWVDGLPPDRAQPQLEHYQKRYGNEYQFRIIDSPFHGGKAIEGIKLTDTHNNARQEEQNHEEH